MIFFRVLQGLGGGGFQPSEQGILIDTFPRHQLGMAMALYGVAIVVAPILGPVLGGYISDNYSWRWIFYINVPIGIVSLVLTHFIVRDPPGMDEEVRANWRRTEDRLHRAGPGFARARVAGGPLCQGAGMGLVRRPILEGSDLLPYDGGRVGRVHHLGASPPRPDDQPPAAGERNFLACGLIIYVVFTVLYGGNVATPGMLQELFGYDAFHAGLVLSPPVFFTMGMMAVSGFLLGKKVDARYIIPLGLLAWPAVRTGSAHLDLYASPYTLIAPRCVQMTGVGMLFVPLNNAAYLHLPARQINNAAGLFNMLRNEGGSLGIAIVEVLVDRRGQFHHLRLAEHVTLLNPTVNLWTDYFAQVRMIRGGVTRSWLSNRAWALLSQMVHSQARRWPISTLLGVRDHGPGGPPAGLLDEEAVAKGGLAMHDISPPGVTDCEVLTMPAAGGIDPRVHLSADNPPLPSTRSGLRPDFRRPMNGTPRPSPPTRSA